MQTLDYNNHRESETLILFDHGTRRNCCVLGGTGGCSELAMVLYASMSLYTKQKGQRTRVLSVWELGVGSWDYLVPWLT